MLPRHLPPTSRSSRPPRPLLALLTIFWLSGCSSEASPPDGGADASRSDAPYDAPPDTSAIDASDASTDALATDGSDAADAAPCGAFDQACCGTGPACSDVTLSCVAQKCQRLLVVTAPGSNYEINGVSAPALTLKAGVSYKFDVTALPSFHPLILTASSTGGLSATPLTGTDVPGYSGTATCGTCTTSTFTITPKASPASFFYECQNHLAFGNAITVVP